MGGDRFGDGGAEPALAVPVGPRDAEDLDAGISGDDRLARRRGGVCAGRASCRPGSIRIGALAAEPSRRATPPCVRPIALVVGPRRSSDAARRRRPPRSTSTTGMPFRWARPSGSAARTPDPRPRRLGPSTPVIDQRVRDRPPACAGVVVGVAHDQPANAVAEARDGALDGMHQRDAARHCPSRRWRKADAIAAACAGAVAAPRARSAHGRGQLRRRGLRLPAARAAARLRLAEHSSGAPERQPVSERSPGAMLPRDSVTRPPAASAGRSDGSSSVAGRFGRPRLARPRIAPIMPAQRQQQRNRRIDAVAVDLSHAGNGGDIPDEADCQCNRLKWRTIGVGSVRDGRPAARQA